VVEAPRTGYAIQAGCRKEAPDGGLKERESPGWKMVQTAGAAIPALAWGSTRQNGRVILLHALNPLAAACYRRQETLGLPVTTRKCRPEAVGPVSPFSPFGPGMPGGPGSPLSPFGPTRTKLSDIVHPVSSSQLAEFRDRVRSFGGYNNQLN
jgi:hypothetical protein